MKEDQITVEVLETQSAVKSTRDLSCIEVWLPARKECYNVIAQSVYGGKGLSSLSNRANLSSSLIADDLPIIVRNIVTKFLWFDGALIDCHYEDPVIPPPQLSSCWCVFWESTSAQMSCLVRLW